MDNFWLPPGHFFIKKKTYSNQATTGDLFKHNLLSHHTPSPSLRTSPSQQAGSLISKVRAFLRIDDRNSI